MSSDGAKERLAQRWREASARQAAGTPTAPTKRFDVSNWGVALAVMIALAAVLWIVQIVNATQHQDLDRFGIRPRSVDGLWGVLASPFLHSSYTHLTSNTAPFVLIGWAVLIAGLRTWAISTAVIIVGGGLLTWLVAPAGLIVGASGLVFGWLGYLIARAYFTRKFWWIVVAALVLVFFGTLLNGLVPNSQPQVSWQGHICGLVAGFGAAWLLHPRKRKGARPKMMVSV